MATFDKTRCAEGIQAPDLNDEIRANQEGLEEILAKEHNFETGGTAALQGIHKQGSCRCFWQASAPATRTDSSAFTSQDLGALWIDSDNNKVYILTATTPVWTVISTELFATFLAAARTFAEVVTFEKAPVIGKPPTFTEGVIGNESFLQGRNAAGTGNVNIVKITAGDIPQFPLASQLAAGDPSSDSGLVDKKFVEDRDTAGADPAYSGGESHAFAGGLIIKQGSEAVEGSATDTITFGTAFPTACLAVVITNKSTTSGTLHSASAHTYTAASFKLYNSMATATYSWLAIGH